MLQAPKSSEPSLFNDLTSADTHFENNIKGSKQIMTRQPSRGSSPLIKQNITDKNDLNK